MSVDPKLFKNALGRFAAGVTVITVRDGTADHGMTASAFSSLSLDPPLVLVCVNKLKKDGDEGHTHGLLSSASGFGVNILAREQASVSNRFAGWWEEGKSKWADLVLSHGEVSGAALIEGAMASLDCSMHDQLDGGDHTIFIGKVESVKLDGEKDDLDPLVFFAGSYRAAGDKIPY